MWVTFKKKKEEENCTWKSAKKKKQKKNWKYHGILSLRKSGNLVNGHDILATLRLAFVFLIAGRENVNDYQRRREKEIRDTMTMTKGTFSK